MARVDSDTIVVGLESSETSDAALEWAVQEAKRSDRRLVLVHVWHWSSDVMGIPMALGGHEDFRTAGRRMLTRAAEKARAEGVPTATTVREGSPPSVLVEASAQAAMLVVGRHGRGPLRRTVMGSTSKHCVEHAHVPVVVVPGHEMR